MESGFESLSPSHTPTPTAFARRRLMDNWRRCLEAVGRVRVLFAVLLGFVATQLHAQDSSPEHPPPGRLIDVGGRKLHLYCTGSGSPTLILMAGGSAFSIDWVLVQPRVAESTRVCSYDRAGLGWSDPGPADETVEQTISDLHRLLRAE